MFTFVFAGCLKPYTPVEKCSMYPIALITIVNAIKETPLFLWFTLVNYRNVVKCTRCQLTLLMNLELGGTTTLRI